MAAKRKSSGSIHAGDAARSPTTECEGRASGLASEEEQPQLYLPDDTLKASTTTASA
jgi:hypothetical protein